MNEEQSLIGFTIPLIDVVETSKKLKFLREKRKITVSELQQVFNMQHPQSIYTWENPESKYLPNIDNLVTLSKLYNVSMDEIIILKDGNSDSMSVSESSPAYGLTEEVVDYIYKNSSKKLIIALKNYFEIAF